MGWKCVSVFVVLVAVPAYFIYNGSSPIPAPKLSTSFNWGPSSRKVNPNAPITSQPIQYSANVINQLRRRLNETPVLQEPYEDIGFEYGFNSHKLLEFINYWRDDYLPRWNERQQFLNSFPHFFTEIQG